MALGYAFIHLCILPLSPSPSVYILYTKACKKSDGEGMPSDTG